MTAMVPAIYFADLQNEDGDVLAVELPASERAAVLSKRDRERILLAWNKANPTNLASAVGKLGKVLAWRTLTPTTTDIVATLEDEDGETMVDEDGNVLSFTTTKEGARYSVTIPAPIDEDGNYVSPVGASLTLSAWEDEDVNLAPARRFRDARDEDGEKMYDEDGKVIREEIAAAGYVTRNMTRPDGNVLAFDVLVTPVAGGAGWRVAGLLK